MGCVIEATGEERHRRLVDDYLTAFEQGKSGLIIAPTHAEGEQLTKTLRSELKDRGAIGKERDFTVRRSTGWTDAQKRDARNYEPGMVIDFNEAIAGKRKRVNGARVTEGGFAKGEAVAVLESDGESVRVMRKDGTLGVLALQQTDRFSVSRTRTIAIGRGDRIRETKNGEIKVAGQAKSNPVNNGDLFTVEGFTKDGDIRLDKGKIMPKDWGHFTLGYIDTSYSSQGKTVDRVFIAAGDISLPATNQQQWYVSASRGREQAKLYVDSKEDVRNAIANTGQRLSAVGLTHSKIKASSWRSRVSQSIERNRVVRFVKQRSAAIADHWRGKVQEGASYA